MVFCIYYYYHELVKERADLSLQRRISFPKRRAGDFTLTRAPVNPPSGGFSSFLAIHSTY